MPKQNQRAEINSFVKGLITEASELNFPADAFSNVENFELKRTGTVKRRLGMDYEEGFILRDSGLNEIDLNSSQFNTFRWLAVSGDVTKDFLVVQAGSLLFFFDLATEPLSSGYVGQVALTFNSNVRYSFAALEGYLVVVSGSDTIAVVSYPGFTVEYQRLLTRDVWGIEESNASFENDPSYRAIVDNIHYYNLQNQSWGIPRKDQLGNLFDPVFRYQIDLGVGPSNSEQVWPGLQFQAVASGQSPFERMYTNLYNEVLGAKTVAPKGYFIIDVLRRGQSREEQFNNNKVKYPQLSGFAVFHTDLTEGGATCIADFAGRVFYSGFNGQVVGKDNRSPEYSNYVFFSQIVKSKSDFLKCYQNGDPTSRDGADLVDTDGGFIRISGAKDIIALRNLETSLIVFATNGIWSITGGAVDSGFSATNYKATKISSFGALSETAIVVEGGSAYYWSEDGIYTIGRNELGDMGVKNMTLGTIQTFYESIPNVSKLKAIGSYDLLTKKVRWIIKEGTPFGVDSVTRELIFDSALSAFSVNRIMNRSESNLEVFSLFRSSSFIIGAQGIDVLDNTDTVLSNTDNVIIPSSEIQSGLQSTRYLVMFKNGSDIFFTFGQYNGEDWKDWKKIDGIGVDAKAFGYAGVQTAGDSAIKKQIPYLVFHMYRTETTTDSQGTPLHPSGCKVRYQWNFSNNSISKKFSTMFQVYRYVKPFFPNTGGDAFDNGFSILTTKNKVRGAGRAFQMYMETEPGKDCRIVGWSLTVNGNQMT